MLGEYQSRPWTTPRDVKVVDSPNLCQVPGCTRPAGDAFVCAACLDDLEVALGNIPSLLEDLEVLFTRQHNLPRPPTMRTRPTHTRWDNAIRERDAEGVHQGRMLAVEGFNRVPYMAKAGDVAQEVASAVTGAVLRLCQHRSVPEPTTDPAGLSRWLLANLVAVAQHQDGGAIVSEITHAAAKAMRTIDRPPDAERVYLGLCAECQAAMHANPERPDHRCTTCGTVYDVAECKEAITERVADQLMTTGQLAKLVGTSLVKGTLSRHAINRLVSQGRLTRAGAGKDGAALYRVADLLGIIEEREAS